jgi:hypothetical protein
MGEIKIEHVLLFLVGAFLAYHMMGNCGCKRVEGLFTECNRNDEGKVGRGCHCENDTDCIQGRCMPGGFGYLPHCSTSLEDYGIM